MQAAWEQTEAGKEWRRNYCREYRQRNREKVNAQALVLYSAQTPAQKAKRSAQHKAWSRTNKDRVNEQARNRRQTVVGWTRWCLHAAKRRAKRAGVVFSLTHKDVVVPDHCPVTLRAFAFDNSDDNPSLDRVQPDLGYVHGNVRVISKGANRAKNNVTDPAVFDRLAAYVRGEI